MAENRYRKIEVRMWGDEKFRALTPPQPCGQALWVYLLTGPHTGPIPGLFRAGRAGIAEELGWSQEAFDKAFREASDLGMVEADWKARVVFVPKAIKCNAPQSPNVVTGWAGEWQLIPECELKRKAYEVLKSAVYQCGESFGKAFAKALGKASAKTSPKTSPNQEQEQEQDKNVCAAVSATPAETTVLILPLNDGTEYHVTSDMVEEWVTLYPAVEVLQQLRNMRGWLAANQQNRKTRSGILRFVAAWLAKEQNRAPRGALTASISMNAPINLDYRLPSDLDLDSGEQMWQATLQKMAERTNKHSFETWLKPTSAAGIRDGVLYVKVPTAEFLYIGTKYASLLNELLPAQKLQFVAPQETSPDCSENLSRMAPVSYSVRKEEIRHQGASTSR
jgi:DnaA N-terminal domain